MIKILRNAKKQTSHLLDQTQPVPEFKAIDQTLSLQSAFNNLRRERISAVQLVGSFSSSSLVSFHSHFFPFLRRFLFRRLQL